MTWTLGHLGSTELRLNVSALIIVGLLILPGLDQGIWLRPTLLAGVLVLSILVHELGHATVANRLGLGPCQVMIHGFGGLCSFTRAPTHSQGLRVSLAGPAAGLLLGGLAYGIHWIGGDALPPIAAMALGPTIKINLFWSLFNLLPMFPLDGGQALRHVLHLRWPPARAERTTRWAGRLLGGAVALYGLYSQSLFFGFIGLMVVGQNRSAAPVSD